MESLLDSFSFPKLCHDIAQPISLQRTGLLSHGMNSISVGHLAHCPLLCHLLRAPRVYHYIVNTGPEI